MPNLTDDPGQRKSFPEQTCSDGMETGADQVERSGLEIGQADQSLALLSGITISGQTSLLDALPAIPGQQILDQSRHHWGCVCSAECSVSRFQATDRTAPGHQQAIADRTGLSSRRARRAVLADIRRQNKPDLTSRAGLTSRNPDSDKSVRVSKIHSTGAIAELDSRPSEHPPGHPDRNY